MGISRGFPPSFSTWCTAGAAGCTRGRRESSPLPKARRLVSGGAVVIISNILHSSARPDRLLPLRREELSSPSRVWPEPHRRLWSSLRCGLARNAARAFRVVPGEEFPGKFKVSLGSPRTRIIERNRFTVARRLSQPHIPRNHCAEEPFLEILFQRFCDLLRKVGAIVVHGQQHALNHHFRIECRLHPLQRRDEL